MSTTYWTIAVALIIGFIGGCNYGRTGSEKPATLSSEQAESGDGPTSETSRDQRLVGDWRYTETHADASIGFSMAYDQFMTFHPNGTMEVREGGMAGGNGDFSFGDPASEQSFECEWRTRGNVIEIKAEGRDWTPLAEYEVNETSLLTVTDGSRQLWDRI